MTNSLKSATMAFLILFGSLASADAAEMLILNSTQPDLPEGGIIDAAAMLSIADGASLTLVDEAGRKFTLKGPYSGVAGTAEPAAGGGGFGSRMVAALSRLIVGMPVDRSKLGVTRGTGGAKSDDIWMLSVSTEGDFCLRTDIPTRLWRPQADAAAVLSIKRLRQTWVRAEWPAGQETLAWPGGVELADSTTYLVRLGSGLAVKKLTVHLAPSDLPSDFHRVAWLSETGCLRQAQMLLSRIR